MTLFRPCIDIHEGKVKQIVGGTLDTKNLVTNFESELSPAFYAQLYQSNKLNGAHVIQLGQGCKEAAISALQAWPNGLQIGGGINESNALFWLEQGASHVILTSWLFEHNQLSMDRVKKISELVHPSRLVLDLSCRRSGSTWMVCTNRWQTITETEITPDLFDELAKYCAEFLIHAADVEGLCQGMDLELIEFLGKESPLPVTYAGGASSIQDLDQVQSASQGRVDLTIGSALDLFGGQVSFEECVAWNQRSEKVDHD